MAVPFRSDPGHIGIRTRFLERLKDGSNRHYTFQTSMFKSRSMFKPQAVRLNILDPFSRAVIRVR